MSNGSHRAFFLWERWPVLLLSRCVCICSVEERRVLPALLCDRDVDRGWDDTGRLSRSVWQKCKEWCLIGHSHTESPRT